MVMPLPASAEQRTAAARPGLGQGSRLGLPPPALPVPETDPALLGARHERRRWLAAADAQASLRLCPGWASRCRFDVGSIYRLSLMSRSTPHFSWGPGVLLLQRREEVTDAAVFQRTSLSAAAATLGARLWLLESGTFDPYLQVSTGMGPVVQRHQVGVGGRVAEATRAQGWAPMYSTSFGLDWHVAEHVALGAVLSWTHWLLQPAERCPQSLGVCAYPPAAAYAPEHGVVGTGVSLRVGFGAPH